MKLRLSEIEVKHCRNGMQQLVVYAGGCLHLADYEDGKFIVTRGRRPIALRGVQRAWILLEDAE